MVDMSSALDMPPRVLDLLRIFLDASSSGEHAILHLETSGGAISTNYRSVDTAAGVPVPINNTPLYKRKRKNPARVQRSRLRLEQFMKKKENAKQQAESSLSSQTDRLLVTELDKKENVLDER